MADKKITILVTNLNNNIVDSAQALKQCSAIANTHTVDNIFLYFNAVDFSADKDSQEDWQNFAQTNNIHLIACSTAASKRGITPNHSGPFHLAGLSEFYSRLHQCQNIVQF